MCDLFSGNIGGFVYVADCFPVLVEGVVNKGVIELNRVTNGSDFLRWG